MWKLGSRSMTLWSWRTKLSISFLFLCVCQVKPCGFVDTVLFTDSVRCSHKKGTFMRNGDHSPGQKDISGMWTGLCCTVYSQHYAQLWVKRPWVSFVQGHNDIASTHSFISLLNDLGSILVNLLLCFVIVECGQRKVSRWQEGFLGCVVICSLKICSQKTGFPFSISSIGLNKSIILTQQVWREMSQGLSFCVRRFFPLTLSGI